MKSIEETIKDEADGYIDKHLAGLWRNDSDWYAIHAAIVKIIQSERSKSIESEKAKDERIKELHTALKDLYVSIVDKEYYRFHSSCLIRVKQLLNK